VAGLAGLGLLWRYRFTGSDLKDWPPRLAVGRFIALGRLGRHRIVDCVAGRAEGE